MISPRYAAYVAVILALAVIPTVIHSYLGMMIDDGRKTSSIPEILEGGMTSTPTARRAGWVRNTFASDDWLERTYNVGGTDVSLFVARSYDAKRIYHHPELAILKGTTHSAGVMRTARRPDIPLHVLGIGRDERSGVAVYALLYESEFVDNPLLLQLRTSLELLVSGRRPMTLFMASALAGSPDDIDAAPATRLLLTAIESFERQGPSLSQR